MSPRSRLALALLALMLLVAAAPVSAEKLAQVVDTKGALLTLERGLYGDLVPDGTEAAADASVLVLVAKDSNGETRSLVPTTDTPQVEHSAALVYDPRAATTYVLWSAHRNGVHPMLYLTTYGDDQWGEVLEIVGTIFAPKLEAQLVVEHDSFQPNEGQGERVERTVLHVAWSESRASGMEQQYTALVMENGRYVGRPSSQSLRAFIGLAEGATSPSPLATTLTMRAGADDALTAAFYDDDTDSLASLRIEVLPQALSRLANAVEETALAWDPASGVSLLDAIDAALEAYGTDFHPAILALLSLEVQELISELGDGDIRPAVGKWGPRIIHIGRKIGSNGLENSDASALLTIRPEDASATNPRHDLAITEVMRWEAPTEIGDDPTLLVSKDGGDIVVAWTAEGEVRFRETLDDGSWSEQRSLQLSDDVDVDAALDMLRKHVDDR